MIFTLPANEPMSPYLGDELSIGNASEPTIDFQQHRLMMQQHRLMMQQHRLMMDYTPENKLAALEPQKSCRFG